MPLNLLNFKSTAAPTGLLGKYYDPAEERRKKAFGAMSAAGAALLQGGQGNFGQVLGQALAGANEGAQNAGINYRQDALGYQQLEQQMNEQKEKEKQKAAIMQMIAEDTPENQQIAMMNPQGYADMVMKRQFAGPAEGFTLGEGQQRFDANGKPIASGAPKPPDKPQIETFFDEKTGQQYKAQFNPTTQKWDRVGGTKGDENGITITNPDGTTTQIGGSGNKTTEADRRATLLTKQIVAQEPQLMADFDTLATLQNSVGGATGAAGRGMMTAEGQMAKDSLTNVLANWLYLTSGATMNQGEIDRQISLMLPSPFDAPETIAAKKSRVQSIFATMKERTGVQSPPAGEWTVLPNGVKIRKKSQ